MKKAYVAPMLMSEEFDLEGTVTAAFSGANPKNGNPGNQNCFGYDAQPNQIGPDGDICVMPMQQNLF